jgi:hypothetical protein
MRSRHLTLYHYGGVKKLAGSPDANVPQIFQAQYDTELVDGDYGHWGYPDFPPMKDIGGEFFLRGRKEICEPVYVGRINRPGAPLHETYEGWMTPPVIGGALGFVGGKLVDPSNWGATAYRRMRPDLPSFNGANALYELKDVPGMLKQRFTPDLRGAGNYFLALKFGWEALLNDCRNLVQTQRVAQKRLAQLIRDNGRPVRRKVLLEDVVISRGYDNVVTSPVVGMVPVLTTPFYQGCTIIHNLYDYRKTWASAQFRYWLPEGPRDINWTRRMLANIYGLNVTPDMVYKAIPWTWLGDWFVNASDVITNMSGGMAGRCAADYYYLMQERGGLYTLQSTQRFCRDDGHDTIFSVSGTNAANWYHKIRLRGDPFGLNTSPNQLTGMQLAILGALGLSRLPK